jgi:hypothetical protein
MTIDARSSVSIEVPSFSKIRYQRDRLRQILKQLDDETLAELRARAGAPVRRDTTGRATAHDRPLEEGPGAVVDGYGYGASSSGSIHGSDVSRPVEQLVVQHAGGRHDDGTADRWEEPSDPVLAELDELFGGLGGRQSSLQGVCQCCDRDVAGTSVDRLRSGYCPECYAAWGRAGRPGSDPQQPGDLRGRWERQRRAQLQAKPAAGQRPE